MSFLPTREVNNLKKVQEIYCEDVVKRSSSVSETPDFGKVRRTYLEEEEEEEEYEEEEELEEGDVEVEWSNGDFEIISEKKLKLVDRSFLHGDVCAMKKAPFQKSGYVKDVNLFLDILIIGQDDFVHEIKGVNSKHLQHFHKFGNRNLAVYDKWLCRIDDLIFEIEVEFNDGSICLISPLSSDLIDITSVDPRDASTFFLSMPIDLSSKRAKEILKKSKWIEGKYTKDKSIGTVIDIKPIDVALEIIAGHPENDEDEIELPQKILIQNLNVFSFFEYENWSIHDKALISTDLLEYNSKELKQEPISKKIFDDSFSIEILLTETYVDVMWENGELEKNIKTTDLVSILHVGEQDFLPEDIIKSKEDENKIGFIKSVDSKSKTCKVKWESKNEKEEEELSIYDIKESKEYQFTLGSVVIVKEKEENQKDWIGEVIDYKDGILTVSWLNNTISNIKYDKVIDSEYSNDDENNENQNELLDLATQLMNRIENGMDIDQDDEFVGQLSTFINEREILEEKQKGKKIIGYKNNIEFEDYIVSDDEKEQEEKNIDEIKKEEEFNERVEQLFNMEDLNQNIDHFQIVNDIEDHHFKNQITNQNHSKFIQKIQQEWKLLKSNLPNEIFVIVSEKNMNLMRGIIIGQKNTPYNNGIFIFDIFLPSNYPVAYPKIYFWSYGSRLNPNLYENGKVCLSLLGTWEGRDSCEVWNPKNSNVLQVLLSLLGLVLVSEPYFNEAGYDKQIGTEEGLINSIQYNENVIIQVSNHHLNNLMNSPKHCKQIIQNHYFKNYKNIINLLEIYLKNDLNLKKLDELGLFQSPSKEMPKALILVGGFGTRLRPLTLSIPKPLVPFANKPMIVHQIEALKKVGVDEVILAINYQPHVMKKEMDKFAEEHGVKITYSLETEPLGTAGPLALARDSLTANGNDIFFVLNSGIYLVSFKFIIRCNIHLNLIHSHGKEGTIMVTKVLEPSKYGVVVSKENGEIQQFVEKPQVFVGNRINAGLYIFNKEILDRIKLEPTSIERIIFPQMAKEKTLYSMDLEDVGQPKDYLTGMCLYLNHLKENKSELLAKESKDNLYVIQKETVIISPSAKIGKDCVIGPDVCIGDNVVIGDGVRIKRSTVFGGTKVGSNSLISSSIIGWDCSIGKWNRIENNTVLGEDIQISDEIYINGGKILPHKGIKENVPTPDTIIM
eukprot:gene2281-2454_t